MQLKINGETTDVPDGLSVAGLLEELGKDPVHCAVEVNRELCRRAKHIDTPLNQGDTVEIVTLVGGG
jgi:thiamine biosynthesis protein ThiS